MWISHNIPSLSEARNHRSPTSLHFHINTEPWAELPCFTVISHYLALLHMVVYIFQSFVRVSLTKKQLSEPCCSPARIKTQRRNVTKSKMWSSLLRCNTVLLHCSIDVLICIYTSISPLPWVHFSFLAQLSPTLCDPMDCRTPRPPCPSPSPGVYSNSYPLNWWSIQSPHLSRPLLLPPSIFPSIRVFSNESILHIRWPKYWSFSFSISPSNKYSGLISFRMD